VNACTTNNVPLQFDGKRSIWVHDIGTGMEWILRPVIRTGHVDVGNMCNPGGQGQPCTSAGDCLSGYTCSAGACTPPIN
jgi:hypothetical protein